MKKAIYSMVLAAGLAGGLSSCGDFLEIEPQNEILFENFWNERADVDAIVAGCYAQLQSEAVLKRMMIWGEYRSDNVTTGVDIYKDVSLENVLKENLKASNGYTYWGDFYTVINRCNTVIKYAPGVADRDPSYTEGELKATIAEVSALRDLCYFYLIRTFRDVPYSTEAYTDDNQVFDLPATKFDAVLDSLITDLEAVKGDAVRKYPKTKPLYQTGRITQDAIHAMLCEMYLWKKDYANCIRYADLVIDAKKKDEEERRNESNGVSSSSQSGGEDIFNGYPLIANSARTGGGATNEYGYAYNSIFGDGNSKEGIFELTFMEDDNMPSNAAFNSLYGSAQGAGFTYPASFIVEDITTKSYKVFNNRYDSRYYENIEASDPSIGKYVRSTCYVDVTDIENVSISYGIYTRDRNKSNWIIYRLTDIMLLKAEALTQVCSDATDETAVAFNDSILRSAFDLVNVVNKRALCQSKLKDTLVYNNFNSKALMTDLVLLERQRELMFEGKRWFDLVRKAMRDGNTNTLVSRALQKYTSNTSVIQSKLAKMDAIFWPYNLDELKVNKNLKQNPAYGVDDEEGNYEKTDQ